MITVIAGAYLVIMVGSPTIVIPYSTLNQCNVARDEYIKIYETRDISEGSIYQKGLEKYVFCLQGSEDQR